MTGNVTDYKSIPALAAYIDRIGAEQLNFKRFMIKEHKGHYYTEKAIIKIDKEGKITCNKPEYAPTKEEVEQIKGALMAAVWPKAILASNIEALLPLAKAKVNDLFIFRNRRENGIIMVQQRMEFKDGTKAYIPWTLFDDGQWRRMEPDGPLPFWKPDEKTANHIMIHEGAKSARYVDWMLNSTEPSAKKIREAHPWADELKHYEHWGIIGGALAPHRADYAELWAEKPVEVVYVCDNDWPGKAALQDVSRNWAGKLKGIKFDSHWPPSFDLGDDFSAATVPHYFKGGRYTGPTMLALTNPATWATEYSHKADNNKMAAVIRRTFREDWFHSVKPEVFLHKDKPNNIMSASEFNTLVSPFSDVDDTARLLRKDDVGKAAVLSYDPSRKPGLYGSDDKTFYINTHVPSHVKKEKGDTKIWTEFLDFLFPVEGDRIEAQRWIATLVALPGVRMHYGMLLVSETQGVGKTTLGTNVLRPLVGASNVSVPGENEVVESNFNEWLAHKRLAVISEIYAGHSSKAYDKLKSIITDRYIRVSRKYLATYDIENWVHILASSNSLRALKISADDRRWFIPKVTEEKRDHKYWDKFHEWLKDEGGLGKIKYWCEDVFLKENEPVKTGDTAPWSSLKQDMVEEGLSPGQTFVSNVISMVKQEMNGANFIMADSDLVQLIADKFYDGKHNEKLERPLTVRKLAKAQGLFISKDRMGYQKWGTRESKPRMICSSAALAEMDMEGMDALTDGPLDLKAFLSKHGKM